MLQFCWRLKYRTTVPCVIVLYYSHSFIKATLQHNRKSVRNINKKYLSLIRTSQRYNSKRWVPLLKCLSTFKIIKWITEYKWISISKNSKIGRFSGSLLIVDFLQLRRSFEAHNEGAITPAASSELSELSERAATKRGVWRKQRGPRPTPCLSRFLAICRDPLYRCPLAR